MQQQESLASSHLCLPVLFRRLGNGLALVPAQRLDRKPGPPQGDAVVDAEHLGGAGRGQVIGSRGQDAGEPLSCRVFFSTASTAELLSKVVYGLIMRRRDPDVLHLRIGRRE